MRTRTTRLFAAATIALLGLAAGLVAQDATPKPETKAHGRVLLVSIDALRPEAYRDDRYQTPNLRALAARGLSARKVVGIFPTLTYPAHTTLATGCRAGRHGIVSNTIFDPQDGGKRWYFEASHIHATTLWDAAKKGGLTTSTVRWPVTVGAQIDWHIAEIFGGKGPDRWQIVRESSTPGLFDEVWPEGLGKGEPEIDVGVARAATAIIEKHKPELMMIHLVQADGAQHHGGRDDPAVARAYAKVDEHLGSILKALDTAGVGSATNVIVTGDHGMQDVHTAVKPNALLREAGFLKIGEHRKFAADWLACANTGGGAAAVYLKDPKDAATAERVLALLKTAAAGRYRGIFQVLDRQELDREGAFPDALCALEAGNGYTMESGGDGDVLGPAHLRGNHGYLPSRDEVATGLCAAGPGLASGGRAIPVFRQVDVAPLVAHLLGIELPDTDGVLVPGVLAARGRTRMDDH